MKDAPQSSLGHAGSRGTFPGIGQSDLAALLDLYEKGLYLQAYALSRHFGPLENWRETGPMILAGRLARNLGSGRLARQLHLRAYRRDPGHPEARYYFGWAILERRGPLETWRFLKGLGDMEGAAPQVQSDLHALRARAAAMLRDFVTAESWLAKADQLAGDRAWLCVERAFLLESEDRYEEALDQARRALDLRPSYRPAVQALAHGLQLLGRADEALPILLEGSRRLESAAVTAQLAALQVELGACTEARQTWSRCAELSPLSDAEFSHWLAGRRSDAAHFDGDFAEAADFARQVNHPLYQEMASRLAKVSGRARVQLPVGFVRQHHMTCAPATLSAISRFWGLPAEHLSLAEAICYDGTPAHSERQWAEQNGWRAREFTVTWDSAVALLDRGVPFTLATVEPGSAHLQAVVGYDAHRGSLIVRDPFVQELREFHAANTFERYRSSGPRGMALVPRDQADRIDALPLPEADLYDRFHQMQNALSRHDRARALKEFQDLLALAPGHRLALSARRALAAYDADRTEILAGVEKQLEQFPGDANLQLDKLACLRDLARRNERVDWLRQTCERAGSDPLLWQEYAWELSVDARGQPESLRLLRRVLRARGPQANTLYVLAHVLWSRREFARATELYRFAACLEDKKEQLARAYFAASRYLKQTDAALAFLADRFQRFGKQSGQPAMTLFWAHGQLEQMTAAFAVLESAMQLRPADVSLRLFAAEAFARYANYERAEGLLSEAQGRAQPAAWLRTAAEVAMLRGESRQALALWRQVALAEPLALDANRAIAQLLGETEGRTAALSHLEQVCSRFPHHFALHQLWNEWVREGAAADMEPVARRLVEINPADSWARRELAIALARQGRQDQAFTEADHALALEPNNSQGYSVRAWIARGIGQSAMARADFRKAIALSVDNGDAITGLLETCDSLADRREAVAFVEQQLIHQVVFGDGLLAFREAARAVMAPEELLAALRLAHRERPDLWHAWSALIQQLAAMQHLDEALELARQAAGRFPLLPRLWLDRSLVHRARLDRAGEIEALEQAVQINPHWSFAARELGLALQRDGQGTRARTVLEQAVARAPLDAWNHGCLADLLWRQGEKQPALERLQAALRLNPGYDWAWRTLRDWARDLGQPQRAVEIARDLTARRAGEARSWLLLAGSLHGPDNLEEQFAALDRAVQLDPRCVDAHDLRAALLAGARRFDEALAACRPSAWGDQPPTPLRARAAWIAAQRGDRPEAIRAMRAVLAENPGFYPGWRDLGEWLLEEGSFPEALEAAKKMAALAPVSPEPFNCMARVKLRLDDRPGAKADFQRAIELDSTHLVAAATLFDLQVDDAELPAAEATLAVLLRNSQDDVVLGRAVRLHAGRGRKDEALRGLRALCLSGNQNPWGLRTAARAVATAGWNDDAGTLFLETMSLPGANPEAGALWIEYRANRGKWLCAGALRRLQASPEAGRRALAAYLDALAAARRRPPAQKNALGRTKGRALFWWLMRRHRESLRGDDWTWGKTGYALIVLGKYRAAELWLGDWHGRAGAQPWMLHNLVWALQTRGRSAEADAVVRHVLATARGVDNLDRFRLWAATEDALHGNIDSATERLAGLEGKKLDDYDRRLRSFVRVLLEFQPAMGAKPAFTHEHRRHIAEFAAANPRNRAMRRAVRRGLRLIATRASNRWMVERARWSAPLFTLLGVAAITALVVALGLLAPSGFPFGAVILAVAVANLMHKQP